MKFLIVAAAAAVLIQDSELPTADDMDLLEDDEGLEDPELEEADFNLFGWMGDQWARATGGKTSAQKAEEHRKWLEWKKWKAKQAIANPAMKKFMKENSWADKTYFDRKCK